MRVVIDVEVTSIGSDSSTLLVNLVYLSICGMVIHLERYPYFNFCDLTWDGHYLQ
ncbi:unnamed protein product [Acanthoscelides obtectus]|uniref:Uncharacterized protein n=1 Tax=Acanthoscelides obtectus TaxID=200917 RepID=A0A9P0L208_ACAOB|nr:unnamed protein product [Acanthoscelides obtectus]CAK1662479.1 hypothetical protein AOBTE_LOCUS23162 [Acanthoscelides obtectus]